MDTYKTEMCLFSIAIRAGAESNTEVFILAFD